MEKQKTNSKSAVQAALESTQILAAQDAVTSMIAVVQAGMTRLVMGETSAGDQYIIVENNIIPYRMRYNKRMRRAELFRGDLKFYLVSKYVQRYVDELWMQLMQAYTVQESNRKTEDKDAE
jgi:hypothetical protein|nr:MAG TPA: hypothetical protein [Caudoviricetes sp.]